MRIAALYDIHANLPALEAVLEDIRRAEVDAIVVGGDVVPDRGASAYRVRPVGRGIPHSGDGLSASDRVRRAVRLAAACGGRDARCHHGGVIPLIAD